MSQVLREKKKRKTKKREEKKKIHPQITQMAQILKEK